MVPAAEQTQTVSVSGRMLKISNLDKVLYPQTGTTKGEVIAYYSAIAAYMVPHLSGRPVTRKRWVHGVGTEADPGSVFFQKNLPPAGVPEWVLRRQIEHRGGTNDYPLVEEAATLVWLAQLASLEIHVPQWRFGSDGTPLNPDRLVLDLDPGPGVGLPECSQVALWAREILDAIGLELFPVTSGSKGIHLYAHLDGQYSSADASKIAKELAETLQKQHPDLVVAEMAKAQRTGKVFIDWSQNNGNKTTISPYSLRGRMRPTVAVPRSWDELDEDLEHLEFTEALQRVEEFGDLLKPLAPGGPANPSAPDRLTKYRSMRDPKKTPEPVPATAPTPRTDGAPTFVIQEHHARRLHYDFRLEHDGVLVSWAVPKGVPTQTRTNHLAVQTEDHPIEYGSFEGIIPHAEYGGGEVIIFDTGTYELEKWRDGREVIVILNGSKAGGVGTACKIALIHTGGRGGQPENHWLMHLMSGDPSEPKPATEEQLRALHEQAEREESMVWHSNRDDQDALRQAQGTQKRAPGSQSPEFVEGQEPDYPPEIKPMLASTDDVNITNPDEWAYEMKWDGVRALCYLAGGQAKILSRRGLDVTQTYPEIADALTKITVDNAVLDGEIVALDEAGRPSFSRLQNRINLSSRADVVRARRETPVQLVVFDIPYLNGRSLVKQTYDDRRTELEKLITGGRVQLPPSFEGDLEAAQIASSSLGMEGLVAKRRTSTYQAGGRGRTWIKIKNFRTQEVVIGGWRPGNGRRASTVGSVLVGIPIDGDHHRLRYIGRVGSGFSDSELSRITELFAGMKQMESPLQDVPRLDARDAHWIDPELVGEVSYAEWTDDGRMRFPVWRGFRPDKSPEDVVVEN